MRQILRSWAADADTRQYIADFGLRPQLNLLNYQDGRTTDLVAGHGVEVARPVPA
jgi:hypothetical protein